MTHAGHKFLSEKKTKPVTNNKMVEHSERSPEYFNNLEL